MRIYYCNKFFGSRGSVGDNVAIIVAEDIEMAHIILHQKLKSSRHIASGQQIKLSDLHLIMDAHPHVYLLGDLE